MVFAFGIPLSALSFPEWELRFIVPLSAVLVRRGKSAREERVELLWLLFDQTHRLSAVFRAATVNVRYVGVSKRGRGRKGVGVRELGTDFH